MNKIKEFIKHNWLALLLAFIVLYLISPSSFDLLSSNSNSYDNRYESDSFFGMAPQAGVGLDSAYRFSQPSYEESAPRVEVQDRKVVTNSSVSAHVKDIEKTVNVIQQKAESIGGFMVYKTTRTPAEGGSGQLTVRVPAERLDEMLDFIRENSLKVVSVNISGNDVTDQFMDSQERLAQLERTKVRFESLLEEAEDVNDLMNIHQRIVQIQGEIDSLKGRIRYLDETSSTVLISINLSTDEYALPYVPEDGWNPEAVLKQAVRSFVTNMRNIAYFGIWVAVYSPLILVAAVAFFWWRTKKKRSREQTSQIK